MNETEKFEFLADAPITSEAEDMLSFSIHAKEIANQIVKWFDKKENDKKESFVIGVEGEWGTGKTSLINLIKKEINEDNKNKNIISIIEFNPWNFSNADALILEFFHSINYTLDDKQFKKLSKNYVKAILSGSKINAGIQIFNIINIKWQSKEIQFNDKPLQKQKEEIDKIFSDKQILIIIDDIDRLDLLETTLIFKLIKRTANFPNTIFLLSYDRKKLSEKITKDGYPGEEYLEKIIQLSFPLTVSIHEQSLYEGLWGNIRNIIGDDFRYVNEARFGEAVRKIINLINIREVKQYVNLIKSDWKTYISRHDNNAEPINSKINLTDFLLIRLIKVLAPEFFKSIRKNRDFFVSESKIIQQERESKARNFSQLPGVRDIMQDPMLDICKMLFPKLIPNIKDEPLSPTDKGIHRNSVFDLYFYTNKKW